jgi:hypothetical protein
VKNLIMMLSNPSYQEIWDAAERAVEIAARTPDAERSEVLVRPVLDLAAAGS